MEESELLAAIVSDPDEDGPRLVYADFLQERGDARGAFIALQCELARAPSAARQALSAREAALLREHGASWLASLGLAPQEGTFVRGLVERLTLDARRLCEVLPALSLVPVRSLRLALYPLDALPQALQRLPELPLLRELELEQRNPAVEPLLASAPGLSRLARLRLVAHTPVRLAEWPLDGLASLDLELIDNAQRLRHTTLPVGLASLATDVASLQGLEQRLPDSLSSLTIRGVDDRALAGLLSATLPPHLVDLCLVPPPGAVKSAGAQALAAAPPGTLASLGLCGQHVGPEGVQALLTSPRLASLASLDLRKNKLRAKDLCAISASPHRPGLLRLDLGGNLIGNRGCQALAGWDCLSGLAHLGLADCEIKDDGAAALAASPHLGGLQRLELGGNPLGEAGVRALRARFGERVVLSGG